jgi:phosphoesterase RecJ-like protein
MINPANFEQLTRLIARAKRIIVVSHANCGDATGSVAACRLVLEAQGKEVLPCLPAPVPKTFSFLPGVEHIVTDLTQVDFTGYDVLLCVDAAEVHMTGLSERWNLRPPGLTTVNFDHHHTNPEYGDLNIVDRSAPATCAMLYQWFEHARYPIDQRVATCLLAGLLTDTGLFVNAATNEAALTTAARLLLKGALVSEVLQKVAHNKTLVELKLWGRALERLQEDPEQGLVSTAITQADLLELGGSAESLEGVANFLTELEGYRAVLVLKEQADGTVKGSLRTTRDDVDVAAMAKTFGGGGHKKAAGFTVQGKLVETDRGWQVQTT